MSKNWINSLDSLQKGNRRFLDGNLSLIKRREEFSALESAKGQFPFATILACADSRLSPELLFDQFLGDIFVCRTAGNHPSPHSIASIEYSVAILGAPLLLIMGHTKCGAIAAAADAYIKKGGAPSPSLGTLISDIQSTIPEKTDMNFENLSSHMTQKNLEISTQKIINESEILFNAVIEDKLKIAHAIYNLETGCVEFLNQVDVDTHVKDMCQARETK